MPPPWPLPTAARISKVASLATPGPLDAAPHVLPPQGAGYAQSSGCGNGTSIGVGPVTLNEPGTWAVRLQIDTTATGTSRLRVSKPG